jgi:hypothetical protein
VNLAASQSEIRCQGCLEAGGKESNLNIIRLCVPGLIHAYAHTQIYACVRAHAHANTE